jgi:two-component system NarL family sensor kinase
VQQGLTNVAQHASANSVLVSLLRTGSNIDLIISDDGKGFDRGKVKAKGGLGLLSLEERVGALGGKFAINSRNGSGTEITVSIPHKPGKGEK